MYTELVEYHLLKTLVQAEPKALSFLASQGCTVIARRKSNQTERIVPVRTLLINNPTFYRASGDYEYFLGEETAQIIRERFPYALPEKGGQLSEAHDKKLDENSLQQKQNFGPEYGFLLELSAEDRVEIVNQQVADLSRLSKKNSPQELGQAIVNASVQTMLANKATIEQALRMSNAEAKRYTAALAEATEQMVGHTQVLLETDFYKTELIAEIVKKSNGLVVQHMTRVFITGFAFMLYYNQQLQHTSIANSIRTSFAQRYRDYYKRLLPHLSDDELTMERVFLHGIRSLDFSEIRTFAMGFLLHDVGKAEDIEYHEGEAGYDRETIVRHVKIGYKAVMEKTAYPHEAALITGYHHEYYGNPAGYGYFREFLAGYKQMNPKAQIDYLMSYEMEPLIDYEVLAYFPAKMLEVVDVFDSLTDPNRLYKKALTAEQAIDVMHNQFVEDNTKLDPILLDFFERFLIERGTL